MGYPFECISGWTTSNEYTRSIHYFRAHLLKADHHPVLLLEYHQFNLHSNHKISSLPLTMIKTVQD